MKTILKYHIPIMLIFDYYDCLHDSLTYQFTPLIDTHYYTSEIYLLSTILIENSIDSY